MIIIDGLDKVNLYKSNLSFFYKSLFQGDLRQQRKYSENFPFSHLSDLNSDHTYIIISSEINSNLHKTIRYYSRYELELKPLTIEQRALYIEMFFHHFNKVSLKKILNSNPNNTIIEMNNKIRRFKFWFFYKIN